MNAINNLDKTDREYSIVQYSIVSQRSHQAVEVAKGLHVDTTDYVF